MSYTQSPTVCVRLEVKTGGESHPTRHLTFQAPTYTIAIGRGSRSGSRELQPDTDNGWFESRVMSREHSLLILDPITKELHIKDIGSMHGTYFRGERLVPHRLSGALLDGEALLFGTEVLRGEDAFPPLELVVRRESEPSKHQTAPKTLCERHSTQLPHSRNSFSVPDYDDDDDDDDEEEQEDEDEDEDDDDVYIVNETGSYSTPAAIHPPRKLTRPKSVISYAGSITSDDSFHAHTPSPRPEGLSDDEKRQDTRAIAAAKATFAQTLPGTSAAAEKTPVNDAPAPRFTYDDSCRYATESEPEYLDDVSADAFVDDSDLEEELEREAREEREAPHPLGSSVGHVPASLSSQSAPVEVTKTATASAAPQPHPKQGSVWAPITIDESGVDAGPAMVPTTVNETPADALRAPSPSDAALAKPASEQLYSPLTDFSWYRGPSTFPPSQIPTPLDWNPTSNYNYYSTGYAAMQPLRYEPVSSLPPRQAQDSFSRRTMYDSWSASNNYSNTPFYQTKHIPATSGHESVQQAACRPLLAHDFAPQKDLGSAPPAGQPLKHVAPVLVTKDVVVVDSQPPRSPMSPTSPKHKRKADEMSTVDDDADNSVEDDEACVLDTLTDAPPAPPTTESKTSLASSVFPQLAFDGDELYAVTDDHLRQTPEPEVDERPAKRVKVAPVGTERVNGSSWGSAMAWTALGATLGAVGAVAGLVALPADFFV